jgi:dipeptidyl aminopeptidase/acylaminoacyl peptidase
MSKRRITIEDLLRLKFVADPQMSPDGKRVIFTVKTVDAEKNRYLSHLWMVEVTTGAARQFTYDEVQDVLPRWSPEGKQIAFLRTKDKRTQIWVIPSDGGEARQLIQLAEGSIGAPEWSPGGKRIAFTHRPTHPDWTQEARQKRAEKGHSDPPRIITRLRYRREGEGFLDLHQHIWVCNVATGEAQQITDGDYDDDGPVWSPDSQWIAFVANRSDDPEAKPYEVDLWLVPAEGGALQKIPTPTGYKKNLAWSPDGGYIAYIGYETRDDPWVPRNDRLWVVSSQDGSARCLTASLDRIVEDVIISDVREAGEVGQSPIWSRDGKRLFFLVSDRGNSHLYTIALEGGEPEPLLEGALDVGGFSADFEGKQFALLVSRPTRPAEVFFARWDGKAGPQVSLNPLTQMNAPLREEVRLSEPEEIWFKSFDGTDVQGWLLKPPDFDPHRKYPLLLYVHGGPDTQYGNTFFHEFQVHAARGYIMLYTNPRGSLGREESFATCIRGSWGDLDFKDLMAAADFAESLPYVDAKRMAVAGGSYGGYMTTWIVGHTDRFRCAITERGVANRHSAFGTSDFPPMADGYWPGNAWARPDRLWKQSPLRYAADIRTPLLIIHSEGDLRCPVEQAEQLFAALKVLKREVVFVRYPQETNHGLSRSGPPDLRIDRLHRIADWLDKYLKPEPS